MTGAGKGGEALGADGLTAAGTDAIGPGVETGDGVVERFELGPGLLEQAHHLRPFEGERGALGVVLVVGVGGVDRPGDVVERPVELGDPGPGGVPGPLDPQAGAVGAHGTTVVRSSGGSIPRRFPPMEDGMQVTVVGAGFVIGMSVFALWVTFMLKHERHHRLAYVQASHERTRTHRRAALAARREPELVVTTLQVVRAGSFCRVPGAVGRSKRGDALVCEQMAQGRPRWRKVAAHADRADRAA